jgi:hypothetical protein
MTLGTVLCWIAWGIVIANIDPATSGILGLAFFYSSLFLALVGSISIVSFFLHKNKHNDVDIVFKNIRTIFRKSIFLALLILFCLDMLRRDWLHPWSVLILLVLGITLDGLIFSKKKISAIEV